MGFGGLGPKILGFIQNDLNFTRGVSHEPNHFSIFHFVFEVGGSDDWKVRQKKNWSASDFTLGESRCLGGFSSPDLSNPRKKSSSPELK